MNAPLDAQLPPLTQTDTYVFWSANQGAGWMHLLPPLEGLRMLCVDPAGAVGWALARECRHVDLLEAPPMWPGKWAAAGAPAERCSLLTLDSLLAKAQEAGFERYDGLVIHDPLGECLNREAWIPLQRLMAAADRLFHDKSWFYFGAHNPGSLKRWRERLRGAPAPSQPALPLSALKALLRSAGARALRVHPYLVESDRVVEVLPAAGYRSMKNREAGGERLKEWLLGRWGGPRLAPAVGMLALRDADRPSALDRLLQRVGRLRQDAGSAATSAPVMKQYLVFSGHKAIIAAGPPGRDDQDVIAVLTADTVSTHGRSLEAPHLQALSHIPSIAPLVPRLLDRFSVGPASCVVMDRIPGVTLDRDLPPLDSVTDAALAFLIHLHRETTAPVVMDDAGFAGLAQPLLEAAQLRNPDFATVLDAWSGPLRRQLQRLTLPAVFQHGDFKVENVIYEPGSCRLLSVIDWEHARHPGLPVLDLLYLLVYNRIIRGADPIDAVDALVVRDEWQPTERDRLSRYLDALSLDARVLPALRALFMAHHIGCRMHLSAEPALRSRVAGMLAALGRAMSEPAPAHTAMP